MGQEVVNNPLAKGAVFLLFLAVGLGVFLFGGYLGAFPVEVRTAIKVFNPLAFGMAAFVCAHRKALKPHYPVVFAFFLSAFGLLLAWIFRDWPLNVLAVDMSTPRGWAIAKLLESLPLVLPALVLIPAMGMHYGDVFLQCGRLGLSLLLGLGMCALIGLVYGLTGDVFPKLGSMGNVWGWVLLFSVTNGFMEELLLRGLFLRPFENFFFPMGALLLTTLIFTGMHFGANYLTSDNLWMMLGYIFLLGLGNGAIIQRSNSIWGAVLAHSFADMLLLVSIFGATG